MRLCPLIPAAVLCLLLTLPAAHAAPVQTPPPAAPSSAEPTTRTALDGMRLSVPQAQALEQSLAQAPDNLASRVRLIGYYNTKRFTSDTAKAAYEKHALWIIAHRPESRFAGSGMLNLFPQIDGDAYAQAKTLWTAAVQAHPADTRILGNAAQFLLVSDRPAAETLLLQAQRAEPKNPAWPSKLGELYALGLSRLTGPDRVAQAQKALAEYESAYPLEDTDSKDVLLSDLAKIACEAGAYDKAQTYASLMLFHATNTKNWNDGNQIHFGNLVLGRVALHSGDIPAADKYLLAAGKTPGSPQLNSFGPNMTLAADLLAQGQKEAVLAYFAECKTFWSMGDATLRDWTAEVKGGVTPAFGANLDY